MPEDALWNHYARRFRTFPVLHNVPLQDSKKLSITVPVCAEPDVISLLESIYSCEDPGVGVEVILLFNENIYLTEEELELHHRSWLETLSWTGLNDRSWLTFIPVRGETPDPKGGVGWARKLAMDEAARRLDDGGILVSLDADCRVDANYLRAIRVAFENNPDMDAASVYFEHCAEASDADAPILLYELHLRYLVNAQRWCGHPFSFYTVGSGMAVRRNAYLLQGGMNTRRAGEDFYFLQKFIETGRMFEINSTAVYPSSRISNRVPFGTGRAMKQIAEGRQWMSTNFKSFALIHPLFHSLNVLYERIKEAAKEGISDWIEGHTNEIQFYLSKTDFNEQAMKIAVNTSSFKSFEKRFFRYFNAFRMIKYLHFMRDHFFPDTPTDIAVKELLEAKGLPGHASATTFELLELLRISDRTENRSEKP